MFNWIKNKWWIVLTIAMLVAGCVPEDSVRWSSDGSVGVCRIDSYLGLINGLNGQAVQIDEGEFALWPDISPDGTKICYVKVHEYTDFDEAKAQLSPEMLTAVTESADKVLAGFVAGTPLGQQVSDVFGNDNFFSEWVQRYIYEGWKDTYLFSEDDKTEKVDLSEFMLCSTTAPYEKQVLFQSFENLGFTQFSPDGTMIGYIVCHDDLSFNELYVLSLKDTHFTMRIDINTGVFFDWHDNGMTICYAQSEADASSGDNSALGTLCERKVLDKDGQFLATLLENGTSVCAADTDELAGLLYSPFINVQYGPTGRIFFSSAKLTVPTSKLDEPQWSLFCYDSVTGAVSGILPPEGDVFSANDLTLFTLSPDGTKILLPNGEERVVLYDMAVREFSMIVGEEPVAVGEDKWPEVVPAWKGDNAISCTFVKQEEDVERKGLGVYNLDGELIREVDFKP